MPKLLKNCKIVLNISEDNVAKVRHMRIGIEGEVDGKKEYISLQRKTVPLHSKPEEYEYIRFPTDWILGVDSE